MPEIFVKPYVPDQQTVDRLYYPSYLPTELNYSQYASLPPNVPNVVDQSVLPLETRYDPWEAVAAQVRKKYPQQERPIPLLGTGGVERYQTWPERTIRSALTLPVETYQGVVQSGPGLRREDVTDIPGQAQPLDPLMERAQDVAGLAGGTMFAGVPKGAATLGAGPVMRSESSRVGAPLTALEKAPMFYSAVENAVKASKQNVASKEQWLSYLKNQQGVKPEEMQWTGLDSLPEGKITKQQLEQHIADNKVQFNEVIKGKQNLIVKVNEDEPHILEVYRADDPTGERSGTVGEILKKNDKFEINVPELPRKQFKTQKEAEDFISSKTDFATETKFSQYSLPGGENYRELLLQLPSKPYPPEVFAKQFYDNWVKKGGDLEFEQLSKVEQDKWINAANEQIEMNKGPNNFTSSHWDEPNVLAHVRMNDREIPDVGKSLHVEEIQSDWGQAGRKQGFKSGFHPEDFTIEELPNKGGFKLTHKPTGVEIDTYKTKGEANAFIRKGEIPTRLGNVLRPEDVTKGEIPNMPMEKTWDELAIKRVIRQAVEEGKDAISWTPGEAQAARYDLSKQINKLSVERGQGKDGYIYSITAIDKKGNDHKMYANSENELTNQIGKEMAEKIIKNEKHKQEYSGLDLKVGGEGMKAFYDKMMIDKVNALAKKYGSKVEQKEVSVDRTPRSLFLHFIDWAIEHGDTRSRSALGSAWSRGPADPMVKNFIENQKKQPIHVLKLTPELKEAALTKGFALFSETSKVGAPLAALEKSGMTPEIKSRIVPAIKNYETGKIETVSRGKSHEELMMNYHQKSKGNPNASYMDIVNNGLKNNETGYYDPKTKQFYNRDSVSDLESTELMTPAQLKKYEQNKVLWSSGLQFPKPLEQPSFNERWNERVPEGELPQDRNIREFPTNYTPPERFMEKRPVRLTKVDYDPFSK